MQALADREDALRSELRAASRSAVNASTALPMPRKRSLVHMQPVAMPNKRSKLADDDSDMEQDGELNHRIRNMQIGATRKKLQ